jgi:ketosteroid isomerase-like protein
MQRANEEANIRWRIGQLAESIRAMDLERVMSVYAPHMETFDIVPPLQGCGANAKRRNWADTFAPYLPPIDYQVRNLTVDVADDVAFAHSLNRVSGTHRDGTRNELWLRWTACLRKTEGQWFIVHDHVSVPVDFPSGRALVQLRP